MRSMGSEMGERSDRDDRGAASDARDARFDYNGGRMVRRYIKGRLHGKADSPHSALLIAPSHRLCRRRCDGRTFGPVTPKIGSM